jgi:hypothetical protein
LPLQPGAPLTIWLKTMTGYLAELSQVHDMLDSRYDDIKSNRVQPIDGEEVFRQLRQKSKNRRDS